MKKAVLIFKRTFVIGSALLFLFLLSVYIWLYVRTPKTFQNYSKFVENLKTSEEYSKRVHDAYFKANKDYVKTTNLLLSILPIHLITSKQSRPNCPCYRVNYMYTSSTIDRWTVGLDLDRDVGSKKCLDYLLSNFDFLYNQRGFRNASRYYYNSEVEDLSDYEILELMAMMKNPDLYNKKDQPERLRQRVNALHQ